MDLDEKKEQLLSLIKLGMSIYKAELILGCTEDEIEGLEKDEEFNKRIAAYEAISEKELLDKLEDAMDIAADKGKSSAIQWKLERLNPARWASKELGREPVPSNFTIELVGRHSNDKDG